MSYCSCCKDEIGCLPSVLTGCVTIRAAKGSRRFMVMLNCQDATPLLRKEVTNSSGPEPLQGLLGLQPDSDQTQSSCCLPLTPAFFPAAERKLLNAVPQFPRLPSRQSYVVLRFTERKSLRKEKGSALSLSGGVRYWLLFSGLASGLLAVAASRLPLHCSEVQRTGLEEARAISSCSRASLLWLCSSN